MVIEISQELFFLYNFNGKESIFVVVVVVVAKIRAIESTALYFDSSLCPKGHTVSFFLPWREFINHEMAE